MSLTNLVDDWWRRLDSDEMADQYGFERRYGNTYDDFLQHQKKIWTPNELYASCCPMFLAGGKSRRNKNGQFVCCVGCRKIHPIILLYFDAEKHCTIATLSHRLDPFTKYFDQCVDEGNAIWKSPFYCELNGFLRENLYRLRHDQRFFGGHLVKTAIGALRDSDEAQRSLLEDARLRQYQRRHHYDGPCESIDKTGSTAAQTATPDKDQATTRLEMALDVCRLWGLGDTLDVLSIDCMLRTSRVFRKMAIPIAEKRVRECKFVITPLVDGHVKSGQSVFRRADPSRERIVERENGRLVEYAVGSSILYLPKRDKLEDFSNEITSKKHITGNFLPATSSKIVSRHDSERHNESSEAETLNGFCWSCEELSYTNLELEFMDICVPEYVGQKVIVHWQRDKMDIPNQPGEGQPSPREPSSLAMSMMPVFRLKLDWASQQEGIKKFSAPHFDLKLDVQRTSVLQVDEVTFLYKGNAKILECRADFAFLVAAYARSLEASLVAHHQKIETTRPLLEHERAFLKEVQLCASICSSSPRACASK